MGAGGGPSPTLAELAAGGGENEALVGVPIAVVDLKGHAAALVAIGDIHGAAVIIHDQRVAVLAGFETPLLAGPAVEGGGEHDGAVLAGGGFEVISVIAIANKEKAARGRVKDPDLVVHVARRHLHDITPVGGHRQRSSGLHVGDLVPTGSGESSLGPGGRGKTRGQQHQGKTITTNRH